MARHQQEPEKKEEKVEVLSNAPVEPEPEEPGTMTAAAAAAISPVYEKGEAKNLEPTPAPEVVIRRYRVLADKHISNNGQRAFLREGKEFDERAYNVAHLKRQGVRLEEIVDES